jgi:hypothetical protein
MWEPSYGNITIMVEEPLWEIRLSYDTLNFCLMCVICFHHIAISVLLTLNKWFSEHNLHRVGHWQKSTFISAYLRCFWLVHKIHVNEYHAWFPTKLLLCSLFRIVRYRERVQKSKLHNSAGWSYLDQITALGFIDIDHFILSSTVWFLWNYKLHSFWKISFVFLTILSTTIY